MAMLWIVLLAAGGVSAAEPCCEQGLLFRLQSGPSETPPSWLFATIHSDDPRVTELPLQVEQAFEQAHELVLELVPNAAMLETARAAMLLAPASRLSALLPQRLYDDLVAVLGTNHGMTTVAIDRLRPWAALLVLSTPPASGRPVLDLVLYQRALQSGKPVRGLETVEQQLAVFEDLGLADQIRLLETTLRVRDQLPGVFNALVETYLARDLGELMQLGHTLVADDPELDARLRKALIDDRNRRMFDRLQTMLQQGPCFIAVGALHLPGDNGLLKRLRRAGFEVTRVDETPVAR